MNFKRILSIIQLCIAKMLSNAIMCRMNTMNTIRFYGHQLHRLNTIKMQLFCQGQFNLGKILNFFVSE